MDAFFLNLPAQGDPQVIDSRAQQCGIEVTEPGWTNVILQYRSPEILSRFVGDRYMPFKTKLSLARQNLPAPDVFLTRR
jgi:hypothetical protein